MSITLTSDLGKSKVLNMSYSGYDAKNPDVNMSQNPHIIRQVIII
jgi:hypothetical protein